MGQRASNLWSSGSSTEESVVLTGTVFDRDLNQTIQIKRIESNRRTFKTKKQAEQPASNSGKKISNGFMLPSL